MVMFLYRPEYYGITQDENGMPTQGIGEVIIAKHRNGSLDNVQLKFVGKYTKFSDLDSFGGGATTYGSSFPGEGASNFEDGSTVTFKSKANNPNSDINIPPSDGNSPF